MRARVARGNPRGPNSEQAFGRIELNIDSLDVREAPACVGLSGCGPRFTQRCKTRRSNFSQSTASVRIQPSFSITWGYSAELRTRADAARLS